MPDRFFPRPNPEDRKAAIADPGPSWREYLLGPFAKVYVVLGFLIVDSSVAVFWFEPSFDLYGLLPSLALFLYLEYLGYQWLWYVPSAGPSASSRPEGWHRWVHPFPYGRWTAEYRRWKRGQSPSPFPSRDGPDPSEFF